MMARILATHLLILSLVLGFLTETAAEGRTHDVVIVQGGQEPRGSFDMLIEGFKNRMVGLMTAQQSQVNFHLLYLKMTEDQRPATEDKTAMIFERIHTIGPALICGINSPELDVDEQIVKPLSDSSYTFVALNPIPVRSGLIESWDRPGGNVTGVGVFLQFNSLLRLMKTIDPEIKKVAFFSWDAIGIMNDWFEEEITRASQEEGIELAEFRRIPHIEAEQEFFKEYNQKGRDYFLTGGVSAYSHQDGTPVQDVFAIEGEWYREHMQIPLIWYDETSVRHGNLGGTCVVWNDIGAQLAEKGARIINGEHPGDIPWDYPRTYNIIINLQRAKALGLEISPELIGAAYRIYTDYEGNFVGHE